MTLVNENNAWLEKSERLTTPDNKCLHKGGTESSRKMLSAWDLPKDNLMAITTDSGTNVVKAAKDNGWTQKRYKYIHIYKTIQ